MDTQTIVKELLATGLSQTELAKLAGCSPNTITQYASGVRGQRPSFAIGTKLLSLHKARCRNRRKAATSST